MSQIGSFVDIMPRHLRNLSKTESKIMETLIRVGSGNAYCLWKQSKLKHYPTVLRTLKKLAEKNFVEIVSKDGVRRETVYALTVQGTIGFYVVRNKEQEMLDFLINNSRLFRELNKGQAGKEWMYSIIIGFSWDVKKGEKTNIDELVEDTVKLHIANCLANIYDDSRARKALEELSKVGWAKSLITESAAREIDRTKEILKALTEFKEEMEK